MNSRHGMSIKHKGLPKHEQLEFCDCYCHEHTINAFYNEGKYCSQCSENCKLKYTKQERWERSGKHLLVSMGLFFTVMMSVISLVLWKQGTSQETIIVVFMVGIWPAIIMSGFGIYKMKTTKIQSVKNA